MWICDRERKGEEWKGERERGREREREREKTSNTVCYTVDRENFAALQLHSTYIEGSVQSISILKVLKKLVVRFQMLFLRYTNHKLLLQTNTVSHYTSLRIHDVKTLLLTSVGL